MNIVSKQNNFFFLLGALLILLLSIPLMIDVYGKNNWFVGHLGFSVTLLFSVLSFNRSKKWLICGILLVFCSVVFSLLALYFKSTSYLSLSLLFDFVFLLIVINITLRQVIFSEQINLHNVAGAMCVYLLLGIIWSLVYYVININLTGSFNGNLSSDLHMQLNDFIYYSFVTLTTLGFGDIIPVSATARSLTYIEAIFGQFYIATLVAGLVSIHTSNRLSRYTLEK